MALIAHQLSKKFGEKIAVDQLSFTIETGQIVALLGANGAGKSTTMRMLAGYWKPSAGKITICDHDLEFQPIAAKKRLGYLPEHNPLYPDMYVYEYLQFMGHLHGLNKQNCITQTKKFIDWCQLGDVQNKKIGILSKGYRQRVGLAQALIHNPSVLILDEPTAGLDPNQLQYIRGLIKDLSSEKAILFSTHIIQEAEAICDRVIILHQGKLHWSALLTEAATAMQSVWIVRFNQPIVIADLQAAIPPLNLIEPLANNQYILRLDPGKHDVYEYIFNFAKQRGLLIQRLEQKKENLEQIFIRVTQAQASTTQSLDKPTSITHS
jgi:ABC-2 type transport system ATP-binding protein